MYYLEKIEIEHSKKRNLTIKELRKTHKKAIIRTVHHQACTGGTLISKCIACMPSIALISEVNPMNRKGSKFSPTNPLLLLERGYRQFSKEERIECFRIQVNHAMELCQKDDVDLVLRDHSHTDFYSGEKEPQGCTIKTSLENNYDLISVVTIRHPLDSYLSLIKKAGKRDSSQMILTNTAEDTSHS